MKHDKELKRIIDMELNENIRRIREMMISEEMVQSDAWKTLKKTLDGLKDKKKVLLLSCSNRFNWDDKDVNDEKLSSYKKSHDKFMKDTKLPKDI